jgi:hypothetical protein
MRFHFGISRLSPIQPGVQDNTRSNKKRNKNDRTNQTRVQILITIPSPTHTNNIPSSKDAATNERGIPYAPFVERVEDYVTTRADVEKTLQSFSEMIS